MVEGLQFLEVMMMILLGIVGSLVIWLHLRLTALSQTLKQEKALAKGLDASLEKASEGIRMLSQAAKEDGPQLEAHIKTAHNILQDFDYVIDRAEKILKRMDDHPGLALNEVHTPQPAVTEKVSVKEEAEEKVSPEVVKRARHQGERSVLWGKDIEQVLTQKQATVKQARKDDVRATFMKAIAEREKRMEGNATLKKAPMRAPKDTLDFLEGVKKTAPRGYGAQAYGTQDNNQDALDPQDIDALRTVLETH